MPCLFYDLELFSLPMTFPRPSPMSCHGGHDGYTLIVPLLPREMNKERKKKPTLVRSVISLSLVGGNSYFSNSSLHVSDVPPEPHPERPVFADSHFPSSFAMQFSGLRAFPGFLTKTSTPCLLFVLPSVNSLKNHPSEVVFFNKVSWFPRRYRKAS